MPWSQFSLLSLYRALSISFNIKLWAISGFLTFPQKKWEGSSPVSLMTDLNLPFQRTTFTSMNLSVLVNTPSLAASGLIKAKVVPTFLLHL